MKKDFNDALKKNSAFDGFAISQTEEEREAQKASDATTTFSPPITIPAQVAEPSNFNFDLEHLKSFQIPAPALATKPNKPKKQRRISLYMEEGELLSNLDAYCQVHGISKNKLIVKMIEQYLTEERMQKVRQSLAALE